MMILRSNQDTLPDSYRLSSIQTAAPRSIGGRNKDGTFACFLLLSICFYVKALGAGCPLTAERHDSWAHSKGLLESKLMHLNRINKVKIAG
jgi:hypothetical protein